MFCFFLDSSFVPSLHLLFSQLFLPVSMLHWPECDQLRAEFGWIERKLTVLSIQIQWYCKTRCGVKGRISFILFSVHDTVYSDQSIRFCFVCSFFNSGTIVSVGDPKKKYTRFEKIGQGWVINPSCISSLLRVQFHLFVIFTLLFIWWLRLCDNFSLPIKSIKTCKWCKHFGVTSSKKQKKFPSNRDMMTYFLKFNWNSLLSVFRASGTVYTAIDIATGQEVGFLYHPPNLSSPSCISLFFIHPQFTASLTTWLQREC